MYIYIYTVFKSVYISKELSFYMIVKYAPVYHASLHIVGIFSWRSLE